MLLPGGFRCFSPDIVLLLLPSIKVLRPVDGGEVYVVLLFVS
jgi:hypothetical protein